jgi:hypothetical protein
MVEDAAIAEETITSPQPTKGSSVTKPADGCGSLGQVGRRPGGSDSARMSQGLRTYLSPPPSQVGDHFAW